MFAIIKTGGKQYKIKEKDIIFVEKLKNKKGDKIDIKDVLLLSNDEKNIKIGSPFIKGISVGRRPHPLPDWRKRGAFTPPQTPPLAPE